MKDFESVLYIEDDPIEGEVTRRLHDTISKKFYNEVRFDIATTWNDGVDYVERHKPDVVILDLALYPEQNTEKTVEEVKRHWKEWPPILVLTGNTADPSLRKRCILAGASDFMLKGDARHGGFEQLCERIYNCYLRRQREEGA